MSDADLRMAIILGWLISRLARVEQRSEIDVAAEVLAYTQKLEVALRNVR